MMVSDTVLSKESVGGLDNHRMLQYVTQQGILYDTMHVANYMGIRDLYVLCCMQFAAMFNNGASLRCDSIAPDDRHAPHHIQQMRIDHALVRQVGNRIECLRPTEGLS